MKRIKNKIKKEIELSRQEKISRKRVLILFLFFSVLIIILMFIWGMKLHKETGAVVKYDEVLQEK